MTGQIKFSGDAGGPQRGLLGTLFRLFMARNRLSVITLYDPELGCGQIDRAVSREHVQKDAFGFEYCTV